MLRRPLVPLLLLLALLGAVLALGLPGPRAEAQGAGAIARSECARYDHGVARGVCVRDSHGGIYWLGTLRGYDGAEMYCIDYLLATRWDVAHRQFVLGGPLGSSLGRTVPASAVAALTALVTRHPASSATSTTAAAIGLIVREVMSDVRRPYPSIPGGLGVASDVRRVSFVPGSVEDRAIALWREARAARGPWKVAVSVSAGADGRVSPGEHVVATVRGTNGAGRPQDQSVALAYRGFTGPASVRLGSDGLARITLVAPATPGTASVSARVTGAPGVRPLLVSPSGWHTNPHPGSSSAVSQRGLVGTQAAVTASARVVVEVHYGPAVATQASSATAAPGAVLTDRLTVTGSDPAYTGPAAAVLHGPFPTAPVGSSCTTGPVAGSVTVPLHGDGTYTTPGVTVSAAGFYTWTETLPATRAQDAVMTLCGVAAETTVVRATPRVLTRTSAPVVKVGALLRDHVRITGLAAGRSVVVTAQLFGPFTTRSAALCTGTAAATVRFSAGGDGDYLTPPVRLAAAGVYTWVETLPGDSLSNAVTSSCGAVAESTLAHRTPPVPQQPSVPAGGSSRGSRR